MQQLNILKLKLLELMFGRKKLTSLDIFFAYRLLLNRAPDHEGWNNYLRQSRQHGLSREDLACAFIRSTEFLALNDAKDYASYETLSIREEIVELKDFCIVVDTNDHFIGNSIRKNGFYEPEVTSAVRALLKPGQTFVDIGANIGYFSLLAARLVGPEGNVFSFEPMAPNYSLFLKSIKLNGFRNISSQQVAVSNENKSVSMMLWDRNNSGSFHLLNDPSWNREIYVVEGKRMDDVLRDQPVHLVKIDVEGAEGLVIEGMAETIRRCRPLIIMEFAPASLIDISKISGEQLLGKLAGFGYYFQDVESFHGKFHSKSISQLTDLLSKKKVDHLNLLIFPRTDVRGESGQGSPLF